MSLILICDYDSPEVNVLPSLCIGRDTCPCCGSHAISITVGWMFWGIGVGFEV